MLKHFEIGPFHGYERYSYKVVYGPNAAAYFLEFKEACSFALRAEAGIGYVPPEPGYAVTILGRDGLTTAEREAWENRARPTSRQPDNIDAWTDLNEQDGTEADDPRLTPEVLEEILHRRFIGMRDRTKMYGSNETVEFRAIDLLEFYDWTRNGYVRDSRKVRDLFHRESHRRFQVNAGFLHQLEDDGQFGVRLFGVCEAVLEELRKS